MVVEVEVEVILRFHRLPHTRSVKHVKSHVLYLEGMVRRNHDEPRRQNGGEVDCQEERASEAVSSWFE